MSGYISPGIYILTAAELDERTNNAFQRGVERGRFEDRRDWRQKISAHHEETLRKALAKIANGEGYYGAQAHEYKQIARTALEATKE